MKLNYLKYEQLSYELLLCIVIRLGDTMHFIYGKHLRRKMIRFAWALVEAPLSTRSPLY
jgi:hypothetical protein